MLKPKQSKSKNTNNKGFSRSPICVKLSACLIVKNEEQRLAQCLDSLRSLANEIIVVDTGSSDRTVTIAQEYQARVFHFAWNDDFSQARNYAIAQAKGEWILVIDADELLEQSAIAILQTVMQKIKSSVGSWTFFKFAVILSSALFQVWTFK